MIRKYHNHKPQTTLWHPKEERLNHHETPGRQINQSKTEKNPQTIHKRSTALERSVRYFTGGLKGLVNLQKLFKNSY